MKKLYLHIGPHKTGSTYIQKTLYENREELENSGLFYPDDLIGPQWGHHKVIEAIKRKDESKIQEFFSSLKDNSILSSENFENLNEGDLVFFFKILSKYFETELIFVKRSYSNLLVSNWQENVKHGSNVTWSAFILDNVLRPFKSPIINQLDTINMWRKFCSNANVIVYENADDLVDSVLEITSIEFEKSYSTKAKVNASLNLSDVEAIRILNGMYLRQYSQSPQTFVRDAYLNLRKHGDETVISTIRIIEEYIIEFELDNGWAVNFFEKQFFKALDMEDQLPKLSNKKYHLPSPSLEYLDLVHGGIKEIYERITGNER